MLEKVEQVQIPLEQIDQVIGISSHDSVYYRSIINLDCPPPKSPFVAPQGSTSSTHEYDLATSLAGLSLSDEGRNMQKLSVKQKASPRTKAVPLKEYIVGKENNPINPNHDQKKIGEKPKKADEVILEKLKIVDKLSTNGKIEDSLFLLLQMLEYDELKGPQKLLIHKKISSRALFLRW